MSSILRYIAAMLPYMIAAIPIFATIRYIICKKTARLNPCREAVMLIFVIFSVGLASQTIIPDFANGAEIAFTGTDRLNLIPFKTISAVCRAAGDRTDYFLINFAGNIAMFMPIGFLIPVLWNIKWRYVILIGSAISMFIEITQLFLPRGTDVDDIILNTIGTALGLALFKLIGKRLGDFSKI